jgi:hypothetical protein
MKPGNNVGNPKKEKNFVVSFGKSVLHNNGPLLQINQKRG